MATKSFAPQGIAAAGLCAAAIALLCAPLPVTSAIRTAVRDATRPGQTAAVAAVRWSDELFARFHSDADAAAFGRVRAELDAWKLRARRWELEAAALRERIQHLSETGPPPLEPVSAAPLLTAELLEASVLGSEHARQWRAGQFIDKGTTDGIPEAALVLEATEPVLDQGTDSGIKAGQPVYAGRCVVGRVAHAGRWMSTVEPVTHPDYRGYAQIVRHTDGGALFGARGILEGTGESLCRLKIIDPTAAIEVGDAVYTGERDGTLPMPMYYGRIVAAELDPRTHEWQISVEPALRELAGRRVCVLRRTLNPLRVSAH